MGAEKCGPLDMKSQWACLLLQDLHKIGAVKNSTIFSRLTI